MKKPIKINSNRAPINEEEIKQQKNFQNIWQKQYQRPKPLYKNPKFFGALIIIICLIAVIAIETFEKKEETQKENKNESKVSIKSNQDAITTDTIRSNDTVLQHSETEIK
jgi:hypothetical protein